MAKPLVTLMSPAQPVTGMAPDRDEAALGPSQCRYMQNVRATGGSLKVRKGSKRSIPPPVDGAGYRGSWHGVFEGQPTTFVAFRVGTATVVYPLQTGSYGASLGTTLATDGAVGMAVVRDSDPANPADILVIGNGVDPNLCYSTTAGQSYMGPGIGANRRLPDLGRCTAKAGPPQWWTNANTALGTTADVVSQSTGGVWEVDLLIGQDPAGDVVSCRFDTIDPDGATTKLSPANGILLQWAQRWGDPVGDPNAQIDLFQYVSKLWLHGTKNGVADWYEVPIPPVEILAKAVGPNAVESWRQMILQTGTLGITLADGIQLTLKGGATMTKTLASSLLVGAAVGDIAGDTQYAVALAEKGGRGESRPAPCDTLKVPFVSVQMGPNKDARGDWPRERGLGSRFDIAFNAPANTGSFPFPSSGLYGVVYRSSSDSSGVNFGPFYRTKVARAGAPGTAVQDAYELLIAGATSILRDAGGSDLASDYQAPASLTIPIPIGYSLFAEGGRLMVPNKEGLSIGDSIYPCRFQMVPSTEDGQIVDSSALNLKFDGEKCLAVSGIGAITGANGLSPMVVWTNKGAYRVSGYTALQLSEKPARIAQRGILNPRCSCVEGGTVYWLDPQGRINATDGAGTADLSTGVVKEWTYGRLRTDTSLVGYGGIVRASIADPGDADDSNVVRTGTLNYDPSSGGFLPDRFPVAYVGFLDEGDRLLAWDTNGYAWPLEADDAVGDDGAPIPVEIQFREMWRMDAFKTFRVHFQTDSNPFPWTFKSEDLVGDANQPQSHVSVQRATGSGGGRWGQTRPMELHGPSSAVTMTGDSVPGVRIRGVSIEQEAGSREPLNDEIKP